MTKRLLGLPLSLKRFKNKPINLNNGESLIVTSMGEFFEIIWDSKDHTYSLYCDSNNNILYVYVITGYKKSKYKKYGLHGEQYHIILDKPLEQVYREKVINTVIQKLLEANKTKRFSLMRRFR